MAKKRRPKLEDRVRDAVRHFWATRGRQGQSQGVRTGRRDAGNRAVATGGKQLDGFNQLIRELLRESGIAEKSIFHRGREDVTLPGFFRPSKQWDLLVVREANLLGAVECKALCGPSFGNNFNNRIEEAVGSATDAWTAYREGAFRASPKPFLGYVLILEDDIASRRPVAVLEKHFPVFTEFNDASYAVRCEEALRRLVRERCYDAAALILSPKGRKGDYMEPAEDLSFSRFVRLLCGMVVAAADASNGR